MCEVTLKSPHFYRCVYTCTCTCVCRSTQPKMYTLRHHSHVQLDTLEMDIRVLYRGTLGYPRLDFYHYFSIIVNVGKVRAPPIHLPPWQIFAWACPVSDDVSQNNSVPCLQMQHYSPECPVVVVADSVHQLGVSSGCASDWTVPTVAHSSVHVACKERLEAATHFEPVLSEL